VIASSASLFTQWETRLKTTIILAFIVCTAAITLTAQGVVSTVVIGAPDSTIINKNIYGHFSEHLGRCIYGGFFVGESSTTIPNKHGIRTDIVTALRKMKIPNLRWPGGCFADTYHWKDGVGPKEKRPTIVNTWWGGVTENNSFGTNEFLDLCDQLGAEPFISGNVGSGTVQELAEWVQYTNFDGVSPMSDLRKANGREKGWNVKYWGIGNEPWGCGGNMRADYYVDTYRKFVTFMTGTWRTPLFRIAAGSSSFDYAWTETLMKNIPLTMMDGLGLHHYSVIAWDKKGSAAQFSDGEYYETLKRASMIDEIIQKHSAIMDRYDAKKKIALIVDEWGGWYDIEPGGSPLYQQNTMRDAMIAGMTLNIFNNHADRVRMANLAQTINVLQAVILTEGEKMLLTPTYHVMEMYSVHQDARRLPVTVHSALYTAGRDTLPSISASASQDATGAIHVSLVNIDAANTHDVAIEFSGKMPAFADGRLLSSGSIRDHNTFDQPYKVQPVKFSDAHIHGNTLTVTLPACSVVVLELR
jgi:alpha-N-arabinofuranosidase